MDLEKLFQDDAFKALSTERKEAFKQLAKKIEGKSQLDIMGIILDFQKTMPKDDKTLTREENTAMMRCLMENVPESERKKFSAIIQMINC